MHDFKAFKKNRKATVEALKKSLDETASGKKKYVADERYWQPTVDKNQNGSAVIRFLPSPQGPSAPCWVQMFSHGFKGPTGLWYIENSRTTLDGESDPVSELNNELWNAGDKDTARAQKRKLHFMSNILVIKDPGNPENEGKVFLFKYGKKIFEKLNDAMNPEFEDTVSMNPFDMEEGAPFSLRIRKYEGYRNYDKSSFGAVNPMAPSEEEMVVIYKETYDLNAEVSDDKFKSYDVLKKRLNLVLGAGIARRAPDETDAPEGKYTPPSDTLNNGDDDSEEDFDAMLDQLSEKAE